MDDPPDLGPTYIHSSVLKLWAETLDLTEIDPTQRWDDAGGDSIAALQLLLKLEQALGLKLPFEAVQPDTTAGALIATAEDSRTQVVAGVGPRVYLLPGLFGYEAILRDLQVDLRDQLALEILELPDLSHGPQALADLEASGRVIAAEIERRQPTGSIFLGGFCYGGAVAFEAATALLDKGRRVAFLGILDTPFAAPGWDMTDDLIGFRIQAMNGWRPKALQRFGRPRTALLVASDRFNARITSRWRTLVPVIRTFVVPGGHADILRSSLPEVATIFRQAVADTVARPRHPADWLAMVGQAARAAASRLSNGPQGRRSSDRKGKDERVTSG